MFETYRMLGEHWEGELTREAERLAQGVAASSGRRRGRVWNGPRVVVAALLFFGAGRGSRRATLEIDGMEDERRPSRREGGAATPTR